MKEVLGVIIPENIFTASVDDSNMRKAVENIVLLLIGKLQIDNIQMSVVKDYYGNSLYFNFGAFTNFIQPEDMEAMSILKRLFSFGTAMGKDIIMTWARANARYFVREIGLPSTIGEQRIDVTIGDEAAKKIYDSLSEARLAA